MFGKHTPRCDPNGNGSSVDPAPPYGVAHKTVNLLNSSSADMAINGSSTPVEFKAGPAGGLIWYPVGLQIAIQDLGNNTMATFGALAGGLTNGLKVFQHLNSTDYELFLLKNNSQIASVFTHSGFFRGSGSQFIMSQSYFSGMRPFGLNTMTSRSNTARSCCSKMVMGYHTNLAICHLNTIISRLIAIMRAVPTNVPALLPGPPIISINQVQ